jgi:hypothetical protein
VVTSIPQQDACSSRVRLVLLYTFPAMRLTEHERQAIREVVRDLTGGRGRALLFGSRLDDASVGGDIDLYVECVETVEHPARLAASIGASLEMRLGEQRIDVLIGAPNLRRLPVHETARRQGVGL